MSPKMARLLARRNQAQAARARAQQPQKEVTMQDQPMPQQPLVQGPSFKSLEDPVIPFETIPSVRQLLVDSARHNPAAALQALKQTEAVRPTDRQPVQLTHTLNIAVPPEMFLSAGEDIKAAAREALGL